MTTETIIDPNAAEAAAARAEIADLAAQVALHERAVNTVERQIASIVANDLDPIRSELQRLRWRHERAEARLDIANYRALALSEEARRGLLREAEGSALRAYRVAQQWPGSPKERIEAEWAAVVGPFASSKQAVGLQRVDGTELTQIEHEATFYKRFVAVKKKMEEFAR